MRESALWVKHPAAAVTQIAAWLGERAAAAAGDEAAAERVDAPNGSDAIAGATFAMVEGVRERCVRFGRDAQVAGILTEPDTPGGAAPATPPVLFLHTGADHHIGPNRMWTTWARRWARRGVTTLRFDPAGIGDTPAAPGDEDAPPAAYTEGRLAEVAAAATYLCERTGADRVVLVGLCSGAYYAVHAAAAGVPVARVIAMNPQLYEGHEVLDRAAVEGHRAPAELGVAARDPRRWGRVLRGETSVRGVAAMLATHAGRAARAAATAAKEEARALAARRALRGGALAPLWRAGGAGVPLSFVFAQEDEGWAYLRVQARVAWRAYWRTHRRRRVVRLHVLERTQHTFMRAWMQQRLYDVVTRELLGR